MPKADNIKMPNIEAGSGTREIEVNAFVEDRVAPVGVLMSANAEDGRVVTKLDKALEPRELGR